MRIIGWLVVIGGIVFWISSEPRIQSLLIGLLAMAIFKPLEALRAMGVIDWLGLCLVAVYWYLQLQVWKIRDRLDRLEKERIVP
jgi:hypothetical protein